MLHFHLGAIDVKSHVVKEALDSGATDHAEVKKKEERNSSEG